jgi:VanZ family protein
MGKIINNVIGIMLAGMVIGESITSQLYRPENWVFNVIFVTIGLILVGWWVLFFRRSGYDSKAAHKNQLYKEGYRKVRYTSDHWN